MASSTTTNTTNTNSVTANANITHNSSITTSLQPSTSSTLRDRRLTSKVRRRSLSLAVVSANRHATDDMNNSHNNNMMKKVSNTSLTSSSPLLTAMAMTNRSKTRRHMRRKVLSNTAAGANVNNKTYNFQRSLFTLYIDDCGSAH